MNDTETQAKYVEIEGQPLPPDWPERPASPEPAIKAMSGWMMRHSSVAITLTAVAFALLALEFVFRMQRLALADRRPRPVNALADPHHLADTDPEWAGGDALRIRRLVRKVTPPIVRPTLGLVKLVPGPIAGAVRTGLEILVALTPKMGPA